jgi:hypothetical protein
MQMIAHMLLLLALPALAVAGLAWTSDAPPRPQPFLPGIVSGASTEESMVNAAPDGHSLFWGASRLWFPVTRVSEIRTAQWGPDGWSAARTAPFSRGFSDADPFPVRDGSGVLISSMRPVDGVPRRDFDIWLVPRTAEGRYQPARNLGPGVNSDDDELYATTAIDGTIYFGSNRTGLWQIYRARRSADGSYAGAEPLPEPVNLPGIWSFNPFVSADGRTLVFTSINRPGGFGKGDLWVAQADATGRFATPKNLGPAINTAEEEFHPTITPDGRALMFIQRNTSRPDGNAEAMWVATTAIAALNR